MYRDINTYVPFAHENIDSKNQLLNFARSKDGNKVEDVLAATIIYTNLVDYLVQHLLAHLRKMCSITTYKTFGAVFYYDPSEEKTNMSLGQLIHELKSFGFPDREGLLKELKAFAETRNRIMHGLMTMDLKSNAAKFDEDLDRISKAAEEILAKYNLIIGGMSAVWAKVYPDTQASDSNSK